MRVGDGRRGECQKIFADQTATFNRQLSDDIEGESEIRRCIRLLLSTELSIHVFRFAGGSRVTRDHIAADKKNDRSIEGHGEEDTLGRARICGAVDKGLK